MPMNWTKAREFYGLERPFNFNVAIPFLLNACVLALLLAACAFLFWNSGLHVGTARFYFLLYIACLLLIAAAFSKISKLSYAILAWCTIELGLALGTEVLGKHGSFMPLCPENFKVVDDPWDSSSMYHPLLQSVPRPNWVYTVYLDFRDPRILIRAKAADIDVRSLQGQKLVFVQNSLGLRGKELTPDDLARDLIFVYGGSTTYDIGVTQGETWVEHLQSELNNKYTIVNFGVPSYTTVEHLIQTAFYQNVLNKKPVCAVYYIGWNDILNAHIEHLDSAYADYALLDNAERKPDLVVAKYSPLGFLLNQLGRKRFDTVPWPPDFRLAEGDKPKIIGRDEHLEAIFIEHVKTIAAINEARGIKTIFIGQILNRKWPGSRYAPFVREEDFVALMESFKLLLRSAPPQFEQSISTPELQISGGMTLLTMGILEFQELENLRLWFLRKLVTIAAK